jgi:RHS repeat-associated protein
VKMPGPAAQALSSRYAPRWYARTITYDALDRVVTTTTGARSPELVGMVPSLPPGTVRLAYNARGQLDSVDGSHGPLVTGITRAANHLVTEVRWGDLATTTTQSHYDNRRRLRDQNTSRSLPPGANAAAFQMLLQDDQYTYDVVNNPTEIHDYRIPEEWPPGAKPVTKRITYDDLYRAAVVNYEFESGDDDWVSPFLHEIVAGPPPGPTEPSPRPPGGGSGGGVDGGGGPAHEMDPRLAKPTPHVAFDKRLLWQSFKYDWLGNSIETKDDAGGFYDRSLGKVDNGAAEAGPYQLKRASNQGASPRDGALRTVYDETGNLTELYVDRNGPCLGAHPSYGCSMRFLYEWDELGRLTRARRWDHGDLNVDAPGPTPSVTPFADLRYEYDADDMRVTKTANDAANMTRETLYVFDSLEIRGTQWVKKPRVPDDYDLTPENEIPYLIANGVRLARVVYMPDRVPPFKGGSTHVFLQMADHLGSTNIVIDRDTSELVERGTYQAYGSAESTLRPEKWDGFREDYRFTGKEEDVEVGLVYFGKRFYNPLLGRWLNPDPLEVHAPGEADANLYAYVRGQALKNIDPFGLQDIENPPTQGIANLTPATVSADGGKVEFAPDVIMSGTPPADAPMARPVTLGRLDPDAAPGAPLMVGPSPTRAEKWDAAKAGAQNWAIEGIESTVNFVGAPLALVGGDSLKLDLSSLKAPAPSSEPTTFREQQLRDSYDFMQGGLTFESAAIGAAAGGVGFIRGGGGSSGDLRLVSRWGREGLEAGDWVMPGGKSPLNYVLSGKWQPGAGNEFARFSSGSSHYVPKASLKTPTGGGIDGWIKALFNQKKYEP